MEECYQRLCVLQMEIGRMRHKIIDRRLREHGIHPSQHFLLVQLARREKGASQAQLAEEINVTPALVARTLKNLEAGGYITRADSDTDGRRNEICITERGRSVLVEGREVFHEMDARSFEGFTAEELDSFGALLKKLHGNIARIAQAEREMKQN